MGCCLMKVEEETDKESIFKFIRLGMIKEFEEAIKYYMKKNGPESVNQLTVNIRNQKLSPLAYCGLLGKVDFFSLVIEIGGSLSQMEKLLENQGIYLIDVIFINGYLDLLKAYLPYYLKGNPESSENLSYLNTINKQERAFAPIQIASKLGHTDIIKFVVQYFNEEIPSEFDVHLKNEKTGENCALIACGEGQFETVKFLFEECKADFHSVNYYNENAIKIAVAGMAKKMTYSFVEIVKYLIEVVRVDLLYNYEEVLISAQLPSLVEYLEYQLIARGVNVTKTQLERRSDLFNRVIENDTETEIGTILTPSMLYLSSDCMKLSLSSIGGYGRESSPSDYFRENEVSAM